MFKITKFNRISYSNMSYQLKRQLSLIPLRSFSDQSSTTQNSPIFNKFEAGLANKFSEFSPELLNKFKIELLKKFPDLSLEIKDTLSREFIMTLRDNRPQLTNYIDLCIKNERLYYYGNASLIIWFITVFYLGTFTYGGVMLNEYIQEKRDEKERHKLYKN